MCYYKLLFRFFQKTCIMKSNNVIFHFLDIPYEGGWREKRGRGADGCFDQLIWCLFSLLSLFSLHLSLILWKSEGHWGLLCLFRVSLLSASFIGGVLAWEKWGGSRNGRMCRSKDLCSVWGSEVCPTQVGSAGGMLWMFLPIGYICLQLAIWGSAWIWLSLLLDMAGSW